MTLTEFLLARIAEDEAEAVGPNGDGYRSGTVVTPTGYDLKVTVGGSRLRAECEAKRRIVEHCDYDHLALSPGDPYVLQVLALPYADHPAYREEWKP